MAKTFFHTTNLTDEAETEVLVEYTIHAGRAARTYGPAELCYPAEDAEVEIVNSCLAHGLDAAGKHIPVVLSDKELERIETWITENHYDDHGGYDY